MFRVAATALCLLSSALLAGCGDDDAPDDGPAGTGESEQGSSRTVEEDGVSIELTYDKVGLITVIDVGDDVDLRSARSLYAQVSVGNTARSAMDYTMVLNGPRAEVQVMDAEGNGLACKQRARFDPDAGTLTLSFPTRCRSDDDPGAASSLLADPLHVGTVALEARFRDGTDPIDVEVEGGKLVRS